MRRSPTTARRCGSTPTTTNIPNNLAWALALTPDRPPRDYDEAAALARKAIDLEPKEGISYNTLALAEYRRGRWDDAIAASEQSIKLIKGVDASNWFFLAMAHARKGREGQGDHLVRQGGRVDPEEGSQESGVTPVLDRGGGPAGTAGPGGAAVGSGRAGVARGRRAVTTVPGPRDVRAHPILIRSHYGRSADARREPLPELRLSAARE